MYADDKSIGLGGSSEKGVYAFYLGNDLWRGTCNETETFNNKLLSKDSDFKCFKLEVWAVGD